MTLMMAITEETVVAGIMTFFFYGVLPTLIILYMSGTRQRRRRREQETLERLAAMQAGQAAAPNEPNVPNVPITPDLTIVAHASTAADAPASPSSGAQSGPGPVAAPRDSVRANPDQ